MMELYVRDSERSRAKEQHKVVPEEERRLREEMLAENFIPAEGAPVRRQRDAADIRLLGGRASFWTTDRIDDIKAAVGNGRWMERDEAWRFWQRLKQGMTAEELDAASRLPQGVMSWLQQTYLKYKDVASAAKGLPKRFWTSERCDKLEEVATRHGSMGPAAQQEVWTWLEPQLSEEHKAAMRATRGGHLQCIVNALKNHRAQVKRDNQKRAAEAQEEQSEEDDDEEDDNE